MCRQITAKDVVQRLNLAAQFRIWPILQVMSCLARSPDQYPRVIQDLWLVPRLFKRMQAV